MPYGRGQTAGLPYSRLSTVWSRPDVKLSSPTPSEHGLRSAVSPIVNERMRAYYERPAREYDDWWLSTGLFARRDRPRWTAEVEQLVQVINALGPANALDVACGTGFLTRHLHGNVVAIDQSETMATIAAERLPGTQVLQADPIPLPFGEVHSIASSPATSMATFTGGELAAELGGGDVLHHGEWFVVVVAR